MHFTEVYSLGDLLVAISILASVFGAGFKVLRMMRRMERNMDLVMVEHEMLIVEYCKRNSIEMDLLPTRMRYWESRRNEK